MLLPQLTVVAWSTLCTGGGEGDGRGDQGGGGG